MDYKEKTTNFKGASIVEVLIGMVLLSLVVVSLSTLMQHLHKSSLKFRQDMVTSDVSQMFFTRLNNIRYEYLFDVDSSSPGYGLMGTFGLTGVNVSPTLQVPVYPYLAVLNEMKEIVVKQGYDRFKVSIRFMVPVYNTDGTTELRPFQGPVGGADAIDTTIRYEDFNGDGDYNDFKLDGSSDTGVTEQPNTHIKEVTLEIFKGANRVHKEVQLVSWEKFSGDKSMASGATIKVNWWTYNVYAVVDSSSQANAFFDNLTATPFPTPPAYGSNYGLYITTPTNGCPPSAAWPPWAASKLSGAAWRGTSTMYSMPVFGSNMLAGVTVTARAGLSTNPVIASDITTSLPNPPGMLDPMYGHYDAGLGVLPEGANNLLAQATKNNEFSPMQKFQVIVDSRPPIIDSLTPGAESPAAAPVVANLQPFVRAALYDTTFMPGAQASGIELATIVMTTMNAFPPFTIRNILLIRYDGNNYVNWVDTSGFPPVLQNARTYYMDLQGADNAGFRVHKLWSYNVTLPANDATAPTGYSLAGDGLWSGFNYGTPDTQPMISFWLRDLESGIDLSSIMFYIDDMVTPVLTRDTSNFLACIQPHFSAGVQDGVTVSCQPGAPLAMGMHNLRVKVKNWKGPAASPGTPSQATIDWTVTITGLDTTPPVITGVNVSGITQTTVWINWTTDEPADNWEEDGLTSAYTNSGGNSSLVTSHSIGIAGLNPNTTYHFRVKTSDVSANVSYSADSTFTTLP